MAHYPTSMLYFATIEGSECEKPYYSTIPFSSPGALQTNYKSIEKRVEVQDIRGHEDDYKLDTHGFEISDYHTTFTEWHNGALVKLEHYPEVAEFLRTRLQADEVIIFDHSLRRTGITNGNAGPGEEYSAPPSRRPHVDHTLESALTHVAKEFGEQSEWLKGRVRQINVWRPLFGPVLDHPLAFCDARSVNHKDLVAVDMIFPHYVSELYELQYRSTQKWFYLDRQMPTEVLLIKMCDSGANAANGVADCCPHAAFIHPETPPHARPRESIEIRALILNRIPKSTLGSV